MKHHALTIIFTLTTLLFLLTLPTKIITSTLPLYRYEFTKHYIYNAFPTSSPEEVLNHTRALLTYLHSPPADFRDSFFTTKERQHLIDVKHLFRIIDAILYLSFAILFLITLHINDKRQLGTLYTTSGLITLAMILFLFFLSSFHFSSFFLWFHRIAFTNDLWMLNPATDNLLKLFPEAFFYDMSAYIFTLSFIFSVLVVTVGLRLRRLRA